MKVKNLLKLERLIGKIDNDFNISESDWIPRVAAWAIDALSQMGILAMQRVTRKLEVNNCIAQMPNKLNTHNIDVKINGIPIYCKDATSLNHSFETTNADMYFNNHEHSDEFYIHDNHNSSETNIHDYTNERHIKLHANASIPDEIAVINDKNKCGVNFMRVCTRPNNNGPIEYIIDGNQIHLTSDVDSIEVTSLETATYHDDYYDCDVPYIYDDGLLLEALAWYVLFKYLSRGSKHQVYSLTSPSAVLNPFMQWERLRPKAMASVKIAIRNDSGWNNFFFNNTFLPRR